MKINVGIDDGYVIFAHGGAGVGTLTFSGLRGFNPARLLAVTNVTRNTLIYAAERSGKGGAWVYTDKTGGVLTLAVSTSDHNDADELRCIYDEPERTTQGPILTVEDICCEDGFTETTPVVQFTGINTAARTYTGAGAYVVQGQGQSFFCKTLFISASRKCGAQLTFSTGPAGNRGNAWDYRGMVGESGIVIALNQLWGNGVGFSLFLENGDGATISVQTSMSGHRVTSDFNWASRKTMLWIGDSIANASGNSGQPSWDPNTNYTFAVRNWLNNLGYDYRLIQKTNGGQRTVDAELWRQSGLLNLAFPRRTGLIFYNMGANDYADPALAQTNLEIFVPWAFKQHPNATIVVCGPTPAESNTVHAGCETIRASYAAYVTAEANQRLKYVNLGTAFDRTDAAFFSAIDTPGGRIHPNLAGMAAVYAVLEPFMASIVGDIP
jgi:hypothetical protein